LVNDAANAGYVDWDRVLNAGNARFDRIVAALRKPTLAQRKAAFAKLDFGGQRQVDLLTSLLKPGRQLSAKEQRTVSELINQMFCGTFTDGLSNMGNAESRCLTLRNLTKMALALAAYRAEHSAYPAKLSDLAPSYLAAVPKDLFGDGDLHYVPQDGGYLLYSVGFNGQDDGGKGMEDRSDGHEHERWDDIAIRITAKK
jgi:hypothetical protein